MKNTFSRVTAAISSIVMITGFMPGLSALGADKSKYTPEPTGYCDVTVNAYNVDTGELFNEDNVMLRFEAETEEGKAHGVGAWFDGWHVPDSNPHTSEKIPVSSDYTYYYTLTWNDYESYIYEIDQVSVGNRFKLENDDDITIDIYIKKKYKPGVFDSFFVYIGKNKESGNAEFIQFYPVSEDEPDTLRKRQLTYLGKIDDNTAYGDIYITDQAVVPKGTSGNLSLEPLDDFRQNGSIMQFAETPTLRVISVKTNNNLSQSNNVLTMTMLQDGVVGSYNYSIKLDDIDFPYNLDNIQEGDTIQFYQWNGNILIPADDYVHIPVMMGDLNDDRTFTVADLVIMEKWLLGSADAKMDDWIAADYDRDGVIDWYDLCAMRKAIIEELSKPQATMVVDTSYGGYGIAGQDLGHGEYTDEYIVKKGDWFVEFYGGSWLKNEPLYTDSRSNAVILEVTDVNEEGVTFIAKETDYKSDDKEYTVKYGDDGQDLRSLYIVFDGTNFNYKVSFKDYVVPMSAE